MTQRDANDRELRIAVHHPTPETAADAIPRALRKLQYTAPPRGGWSLTVVAAALACALSTLALVLSLLAVAG